MADRKNIEKPELDERARAILEADGPLPHAVLRIHEGGIALEGVHADRIRMAPTGEARDYASRHTTYVPMAEPAETHAAQILAESTDKKGKNR